MYTFFNKMHQQKFKIIETVLLANGATSLTNLSAEHCFSPAQWEYIIQQINSDFFNGSKKIAPESENFPKLVHDNETLVLELPEWCKKEYILEIISREYIENSDYFQIIKVLFLSPSLSVDVLAQKVNMSVPTLNRRLKSMKQALEPFRMQINMKNPDENIEGDELGIIIFIFLALWNTYKHDLPHDLRMELADEYFFILNNATLLTNIDIAQIELLIGIFIRRCHLEKHKIEIEDSFFEWAAFFPSIVHVHKLNKTENRVLNFLIYIMIANVDLQNTSVLISKKYINEQHFLVPQMNELYREMQQAIDFHLNNELYDYFAYNTLLIFVYLKFINIDFFLFIPDIHTKNEALPVMTDILFNFFTKANQWDNVSYGAANCFAWNYVHLYDAAKVLNPLKICIMIYEKPSLSLDIQKYIFKYFNNDVLKITKNPECCDILISDSFEDTDANKNILVANKTMMNQQLIKDIYQEIIKILIAN